eukprot:2081178-Rhodomonas_salina.6
MRGGLEGLQWLEVESGPWLFVGRGRDVSRASRCQRRHQQHTAGVRASLSLAVVLCCAAACWGGRRSDPAENARSARTRGVVAGRAIVSAEG